MSRIGKNPVTVPAGTEVQINGRLIAAKGKKGRAELSFVSEVEVSQEDNLIWVKPRGDSRRAKIMWGTTRSLVDNLVKGVTEGFSRTLVINGVGYRAAIKGKTLNMQLGYSHDIDFPIPDGIDIKCETNTKIIVSGMDRQRVGQIAAEIRQFRPPEPYKGKGIRYENERVLRKEGKKK